MGEKTLSRWILCAAATVALAAVMTHLSDLGMNKRGGDQVAVNGATAHVSASDIGLARTDEPDVPDDGQIIIECVGMNDILFNAQAAPTTRATISENPARSAGALSILKTGVPEHHLEPRSCWPREYNGA